MQGFTPVDQDRPCWARKVFLQIEPLEKIWQWLAWISRKGGWEAIFADKRPEREVLLQIATEIEPSKVSRETTENLQIW